MQLPLEAVQEFVISHTAVFRQSTDDREGAAINNDHQTRHQQLPRLWPSDSSATTSPEH